MPHGLQGIQQPGALGGGCVAFVAVADSVQGRDALAWAL
jgi:hypothetical protein